MRRQDIVKLLKEEPTPAKLDEIYQLVDNTSKEEERELLARVALDESRLGVTVTSPINGFVLYLLTLQSRQVRFGILRENTHLLDNVVFPLWARDIRKLRSNIKVSDPRAQKLALSTYHKLANLVAEKHAKQRKR